MKLIHENFDKSVDTERRIANYRLKHLVENYGLKEDSNTVLTKDSKELIDTNEEAQKFASLIKSDHKKDGFNGKKIGSVFTKSLNESVLDDMKISSDKAKDQLQGIVDQVKKVFGNVGDGLKSDIESVGFTVDNNGNVTSKVTENKQKLTELGPIAAAAISGAARAVTDKILGEENESESKSVYRVTYKASDYIYSSFMVVANSKEDAIDKAMKYRKDKYGKSTDIVGAEKMSASEVEDYKQRGMSLIECDIKTECVIEDLHEDVGAEEIPASPETGDAMTVANSLNALIQDEWQAIDGYNSTITTYRSMKDDEYAPKDKTIDYEAIIKILEDIAQEEMNHVGMLQKAMQTVSPNVEEIKGGEEEAEEVLDVPQEVEETEEVTD